MATDILAAASGSHNPTDLLLYQDTENLIELFQLSHQYYAAQSQLSEQAFVAYLRLLIEPIESICEKHASEDASYHSSRTQFYHYLKNHRWQKSPTLKPFFEAIVQLVQYSIPHFRVAGYPDHYQTFLYRLELIFNNDAVIHAGKQRTAYLLLEQLRQKPEW